jgi:hypothetical protein
MMNEIDSLLQTVTPSLMEHKRREKEDAMKKARGLLLAYDIPTPKKMTTKYVQVVRPWKCRYLDV